MKCGRMGGAGNGAVAAEGLGATGGRRGMDVARVVVLQARRARAEEVRKACRVVGECRQSVSVSQTHLRHEAVSLFASHGQGRHSNATIFAEPVGLGNCHLLQSGVNALAGLASCRPAS